MARIRGKSGDDILDGKDKEDWIYGFGGNDVLSGHSGNDRPFGGDGNDILVGGSGNDVLDGGAGNDIYYHSGVAALDGNDTIVNIDGVDTIVFTNPVLYDAFQQRQGNDLLVGVQLDEPGFPLDGTLTVKDFYSSSVLGVFVEYSGPYNSDYGTDPDLTTHFVTRDISNGVENDTYTEYLFGSSSDDIINGNGGFYDGIFGGAGSDTIHGGDGFDRIRGGTGNDILYGDAGDDIIRGDAGDDYIDGGEGTDRVIYHDANGILGGVWVDLAFGIGKDLDGIDDVTGIDTLVSIEQVRGSVFDDELYGSSEDNFLRGDNGNDLIDGRDGNDTLIGGDGDDSIAGGEGADSIDGGSGFDGFEALDATERVIIGLADGLAYDDGFGSVDTIAGIEAVYGGAYADYIHGGDGDDTLVGLEGNDQLIGGDGFDYLEGGLGADTFQLAGDGASDEVADYFFGDGDVIDLSDLLDGGVVDLSNFGDFVQVGTDAGGVDIGVDVDGAINGQAYNLAATLDGVLVSGQIAFNVDGTVYTYDNGAVA